MATDTLPSPAGAKSDESLGCPSCSHLEWDITVADHTFPYRRGDLAVALTARVPVRTCRRCGFPFLDHEAEDRCHDAVCRYLGVQTPAELACLRESLGLTRAQLAALTRVSEDAIQRWESGLAIPDPVSDRLLFLLQFDDNVPRLEGRASNGAAQPVLTGV